MKYGLVIFDMDGTILDTIEDLKDSLNHTLKAHELPEVSLETARRNVGNGIRRLIELSVPNGTSEELIDILFDEMSAYYKEHSAIKTKPYDGICQVIASLRQAGYKTAVVSNKLDTAVQDLVDDYFEGLFDYAIGERPGSGMKRKPAPDAVYEVMKQLGFQKDQAIYIGDSEVDLQTAENAGLSCIAVTYGFRDKELLLSHGATTFADRPEEILTILR